MTNRVYVRSEGEFVAIDDDVLYSAQGMVLQYGEVFRLYHLCQTCPQPHPKDSQFYFFHYN